MADTNLTLINPEVILSTIEQPGTLHNVVNAQDGTLTLLTSASLNCVIENKEIVSTLVSGQGPAGPPSIGEVVPYSKRTDFVGEDIAYKGEAAPGSAEGSAVWRISKITFVGEDIDEKWAAGNADFSHVWLDHLSLVYN